ncbi:MAG TPA: YbaK/EbsC family protein, partial [Anaerolineaceae bacterium]|nr:YbaK/EbsC family protein [Anaerolineaceae bacterium]
PTQREAEQLTGLQAGGISPLALINKGFQVVIDQTASAHAQIHISGGQRGLNLRLAPGDLATLTNARFAAISHPADQQDG